MKSAKYLVLATLLFTLQTSVAQNIDIDILKRINPQNPSSHVWKAASGSVDWVTGIVSFGTLGYGFIKKDNAMQQNGYDLLLSSGISIASSALLKIAFNRSRPAEKYPEEVFVNSHTSGKSFPSWSHLTSFCSCHYTYAAIQKMVCDGACLFMGRQCWLFKDVSRQALPF